MNLGGARQVLRPRGDVARGSNTCLGEHGVRRGLRKGEIAEEPLDRAPRLRQSLRALEVGGRAAVADAVRALPATIARVATVIVDDIGGRSRQQNAVHNTLQAALPWLALAGARRGRDAGVLRHGPARRRRAGGARARHAPAARRPHRHTPTSRRRSASWSIRVRRLRRGRGFRARRLLKPLYVDAESFEMLVSGIDGFGGDAVRQALGERGAVRASAVRAKQVKNDCLAPICRATGAATGAARAQRGRRPGATRFKKAARMSLPAKLPSRARALGVPIRPRARPAAALRAQARRCAHRTAATAHVAKMALAAARRSAGARRARRVAGDWRPIPAPRVAHPLRSGRRRGRRRRAVPGSRGHRRRFDAPASAHKTARFFCNDEERAWLAPAAAERAPRCCACGLKRRSTRPIRRKASASPNTGSRSRGRRCRPCAAPTLFLRDAATSRRRALGRHLAEGPPDHSCPRPSAGSSATTARRRSTARCSSVGSRKVIRDPAVQYDLTRHFADESQHAGGGPTAWTSSAFGR